MDLEKELATLLGTPMRERLPADKIPCKETSDSGKLCRHPLVSIVMLTFNHEPYIREAIEGILMQKTDFEFELLIGEDASADRTREICFEYQKKAPDKVRVLWSEENLFAISGNGIRTMARCRGELLAFCEGDDFWADPCKLQKQVDLLRRDKAVMCVAFNKVRYTDGREEESLYAKKPFLDEGDFLKHYFHTSTYLIRKEAYDQAFKRYGRIDNRSDATVAVCMASMGPVSLLPEIVSVYRRTGKGIATSRTRQIMKFMLLRQFVPLYLYGPPKVRRRLGLNILSTVVGFCDPNKPGFSREIFESKKASIDRIFFYMVRKTFPSLHALNSLERMIRYRIQMKVRG